MSKKPKFERRHYRALAELLRDEFPNFEFNRPSWNRIKYAIGDMFEADNPRFDRGRFEEACERGD